MTILLSDIPAATSAYIHDQVDVRIGRVTANLEDGEEGTLTVRWTNAAAPAGVRLTNVFLHLVVTPGAVAQLKVPGSAILQPRVTPDLNDPRPAANSLVEGLYVFLPDPEDLQNEVDFDSTLDVGETAELELEYRAAGAGEARFSAHIHASIAQDDLFPGDRGADGTTSVTIRP